MSHTLTEIAQQLKAANKKVLLIYAFNGSGKTRLSREFKDLISPTNGDDEDAPDSDQSELAKKNILYYSAFTHERGGDEISENIKISKGEESNFIWSIFYTLLDQVISVLNVAEPDDRETEQFDQLEYIFIDDPVSSLDENHLIELAFNLAALIKSSQSDLKFIVSTHNALFYNVLFNELNSKVCYMLTKKEDGTFEINEKRGDSNKSFSYHLYLKQIIEQAIENNQIERYHFMLLLDNLVNNYGFWQQGEQNG